jgi:hypothetical protein
MESRLSSPWSARVDSRERADYMEFSCYLVGGPVVVLEGLNHIALNIVSFFQGEEIPGYKLSDQSALN